MTARRQASTTSLSKFARANSPELSNRSNDFCNSFWGFGDDGVEVLFARMRGASRTMVELRAFWKERASIEEDYAKRMSKLAKGTFGKDEIGELRNSIDTIRLETDKQATYHQKLAEQIRTELEEPVSTFAQKQANHKRAHQAVIEKQFKAKQTQEYYVSQAGEKYKSDCVRINSFTAQSALMQGKELEKMQIKLERAQQQVQANERDYQNFAKNLKETVAKWEQDWKAFCDGCQDLEEERIEFAKDNMWAYANAVSTVCVSDDESCEKLRLALEQLEPEKDMDNFVRDYGTGSAIPDPPNFVAYDGTAPSGPSRPTSHPAAFTRNTQRQAMSRGPPPPEEEAEPVNMVGVGAATKGGQVEPPVNRSQTRSRASNRSRSGTVATGAASTQAPPSQPPFKPQTESATDPNDPTALVVGGNSYPVNPSRDPQARAGATNAAANAAPGSDADPLRQTLDKLQNTPSTRRTSRYGGNGRQGSGGGGNAALSPPPGGSAGSGAPVRDYRNSAEIVVGSVPNSRSNSPAQIHASHMVPPARSISPNDNALNNVIDDYRQSFPGERKSSSRRNSFVGGNNSGSSGHNPSQSQTSLNQPGAASREGFAGIGTGSRSASPAPAAITNGHPADDYRGRSTPASHQNNAYSAPPAQQTQRPTYTNGVTQQQQQQQQQPGYSQPPPQGYPPPAPGYQNNQQNGYYQPPVAQPPPPQPEPPAPSVGTNNFTDDGRAILFYVKALYDYQATIEEEFDFQSGDIIAVTATPEDGWWSGELLDDQRRQPNRHVFPSNFVCLF